MIVSPNISLRRIADAALITMALAGLLVSCVQIETPVDKRSSYLIFSSISVDYSVRNLQPTKAAVPIEDMPSADDFTITISGDGIESLMYEPGTLPSQVALPEGTYTISAESGENAFGKPYFYKETDVILEQGVTKEVSLTDIPLANAMVAVTLPDDTGHMSDIRSLTLSDGSNIMTDLTSGIYYYVPAGRNVTISFAATDSFDEDISVNLSLGILKAQHAYDVKCQLDLPSFTFADQSSGAIAGRLYLTSLAIGGEGITVANIGYQVSADGGGTWKTVTPEAGDGYWVITQMQDGTKFDTAVTYKIRAVYGGLASDPWEFTPSMPAVSLECGITHTYESSVLTGSTAVVTGTGPTYSGIVDSLISSKGVDLINPKGTVVRTLTTDTGTMTVSNDWPYIPQGDGTYALQPYFVIGGEKVYLSPTPAFSPAPEFTVTAYAETSYSRYVSTDATLKAKANDSGTGDKVMNIKGIVTISDVILSSTIYEDLIEATLTYDGLNMLDDTHVNSSTFAPETLENNEGLLSSSDVINQAWGTHTVASSFTFDGVQAKSSSDANSTVSTVSCHVTGIPYDYNLQTTEPDANWVISGDSDYDNGQRVYYYYKGLWTNIAYAKIFTPSFRFPSLVAIDYSLTFRYSSAGSAGQKLTIYTGAVYDTNAYSTTNSKEISSVTSANSSVTTISHSLTDVNDNARISIYHNENKNNNGAINSCYLRKVSIKYKLN